MHLSFPGRLDSSKYLARSLPKCRVPRHPVLTLSTPPLKQDLRTARFPIDWLREIEPAPPAFMGH